VSRISPLPLSLLLLGALVVVAPACGKRGPPLPPLHPAPDRPTDVSVVRRGDDVTIRFTPPTHNADRSEPVVFDRIEIYAMTVEAGALTPTLKQLLVPANRVGVAGRRVPPAKGTALPADAPASAAPVVAPLTFSEKVAAAPPSKWIPPAAVLMENVAPIGTMPILGAPAATAPAAGAPAAPARLQITTRFYMLVPYANGSRMGIVSDWLIVPLGPLPPAPHDAAVTLDEQTLTLKWVPGADGQSFHVYDTSPSASLATPITPTALTVAEFKRPVVFGAPVCLAVRSVRAAGPVQFESPLSNTVCVTPKDTFPPPAPTALTAFAAAGAITLTWDAVTAGDLAGYIVLRGEGTGDRLQPLTPAAVTGTSFVDSTTRPGVRYVYAVVAVDNATPANRSKESNRVEETGR
jgi:hypothetical protein